MTIRGITLGLGLILFLVPLVWLTEIWRANRIARNDFGPEPCWFVQDPAANNFASLVAGPRGSYLPNPLRQLNRRYLRIGLDPGMSTLHFAVAALDSEGKPNLWAWSYRERRFWELPKPGESAPNGFYNLGYTEKIAAACPDLPTARALSANAE